MTASMLPVFATPAQADPGHPGVPDDPIELFHEDFENVPDGTTSVMLDDYIGTSGETYTAHASWIDPDQCNGIVLTGTSPDHTGTCSTGNQDQLRTLATNLGTFNGTDPADGNFAVSAYTDGDPGASNVQFATVDPLPLSVANRFLSFSVNVSAVNCGVSAPLLQFFLVDGGTEIPATTGAINPCPDGTGNFATDGSILFSGTELGIVMRNDNGSGTGNDHAFDDIRLLDTTPQLDKDFLPSPSPRGGPVELRFTVTNTSELAAKQGWSFVDTLADGLVIEPGSETTDCTNGAVVVGAGTVAVSGDLDAGQASCTASVTVRFSEAGTYPNDASNISDLVGLNPPGAAEVTATDLPPFECTTTAFLSQGAPANMYEVDITTGDSEIVAPNFFPENINAIGYNPLDNYIYGWIASGPEAERGIARIGSDHQVENLGYPSNWDAFDLGASHHVGDFDQEGHLWLSNGATGYWVEIDLAPGSPTYMQVLDTGVHAAPSAHSFADWGFNPQDGSFYTTASGANDNKRLWRFDPDTGALENMANLGAVVNGAFGGAVYTDNNNNLFTSNNQSGEIWHVNLPDGPASFLADGPAARVNDGAICFNTSIVSPVVELTKTAGTTDAVAPGGTIDYSVTATNVGNLAAFDVLVEDPLPEGVDSGTWTCEGAACPSASGEMPLGETIARLDIDETVVFTIEALVGEDPPAAFVNVATATGPGLACGDPGAPTPPPCEATTTNGVLPIVTLDKSTDAEFPAAGGTIDYEIVVANVGQGDLDGELVVSDPLVDGLESGTWECVAAGGAACPNASGDLPLAETVTALPGGSSLTYTVAALVSDDPPAEITNVATADGPVTCRVNPITDPPCEDSVTVEVAQPSLELVKTAEVLGSDDEVADVGDTIQYVFAVTNTGNVPMSDIEVDDPLEGLSTVVCPTDTLAPGEAMNCTAQYEVTQADIDAGGVSNAATATGIPPDGTDPIPSPPSEVDVSVVDPVAALELVKVADAGAASEAGDEITYSFVLTNTGNVTLSDALVDDPKLTGVTCPQTVLAPGESVTCTGDDPYIVTDADENDERVINIATASARGPEATGEAEVSSEAAVVVTGLQSARLAITGAGLAALLFSGAGMLLAGLVLVLARRPGGGPGGGSPIGGGPRGGGPTGPSGTQRLAWPDIGAGLRRLASPVLEPARAPNRNQLAAFLTRVGRAPPGVLATTRRTSCREVLLSINRLQHADGWSPPWRISRRSPAGATRRTWTTIAQPQRR